MSQRGKPTITRVRSSFNRSKGGVTNTSQLDSFGPTIQPQLNANTQVRRGSSVSSAQSLGSHTLARRAGSQPLNRNTSTISGASGSGTRNIRQQRFPIRTSALRSQQTNARPIPIRDKSRPKRTVDPNLVQSSRSDIGVNRGQGSGLSSSRPFGNNRRIPESFAAYNQLAERYRSDSELRARLSPPHQLSARRDPITGIYSPVMTRAVGTQRTYRTYEPPLVPMGDRHGMRDNQMPEFAPNLIRSPKSRHHFMRRSKSYPALNEFERQSFEPDLIPPPMEYRNLNTSSAPQDSSPLVNVRRNRIRNRSQNRPQVNPWNWFIG